MKPRFEMWKRWLKAHEEKIVKVLIALIALAMFICGIFWYPILYWIWCEIFHRCVNGVPF